MICLLINRNHGNCCTRRSIFLSINQNWIDWLNAIVLIWGYCFDVLFDDQNNTVLYNYLFLQISTNVQVSHVNMVALALIKETRINARVWKGSKVNIVKQVRCDLDSHFTHQQHNILIQIFKVILFTFTFTQRNLKRMVGSILHGFITRKWWFRGSLVVMVISL